MDYLASVNMGPVVDGEVPADRHHGESQVLDFEGRVVNMAHTSGETLLTGQIDIDALRRRRQRPGMNFLAEFSPQIHAPIYATEQVFPVNHWLDRPMVGLAENRDLARDIIERRTSAGRLVLPDRG